MRDLSQVSCNDLGMVGGTPLLLEVDPGATRIADWACENSAHIERLLHANGALLIRGLRFLGSQQFGTVLSTLFGAELVQYTYRSTPRTELRGSVYTATEYHPDQVIPQHNENSYCNRWAMRIGFLCTMPAVTGGATPICDSRTVLRDIPDAVRTRFARDGVMYVRNYSDIDIPWTEVFQTRDRDEVEGFCEANGLQWEWRGEDRLRTRQINQATAIHPEVGDSVWFNQAHLFHVSNLEPDVRASLLSVMAESELPRNTYYGDGEPIDTATLDLIRGIYRKRQVSFQWQRNDLLLVDNMLYSHGREPFAGNRQVLVGMARPYEVPVAA